MYVCLSVFIGEKSQLNMFIIKQLYRSKRLGLNRLINLDLIYNVFYELFEATNFFLQTFSGGTEISQVLLKLPSLSFKDEQKSYGFETT